MIIAIAVLKLLQEKKFDSDLYNNISISFDCDQDTITFLDKRTVLPLTGQALGDFRSSIITIPDVTVRPSSVQTSSTSEVRSFCTVAGPTRSACLFYY
jgi:hypothetical protein